MEAQQAEASENATKPKARLSPEERKRQQLREGLLLSRKHVAEQLAGAKHPRHLKMLAETLAELDARLAQLG